jgi:hypothetical protein
MLVLNYHRNSNKPRAIEITAGGSLTCNKQGRKRGVIQLITKHFDECYEHQMLVLTTAATVIPEGNCEITAGGSNL